MPTLTTLRAAAPSRPATSARPSLWWLSPVAIALVIGAASIIPTAMVGDEKFRTLWRTPKAITSETLLLFGCGAIALAFGALVAFALYAAPKPQATRWPALDDGTLALLSRAGTVLTSLTVTGYVGFCFLILRSGLSPAQLFAGSEDNGYLPAKDAIGTLPGVTTMTQLGIAAVVVATTVVVQKFSWFELSKILIVIGLAVPRAYIYAERLAILELVIPVSVIVAAHLSIGRRAQRATARLLPLAGLFLVVVVFSVFEYNRSWTYYRAHGQSSFIEFALSRLAGYYVTALNNGQLILSHLNWPGRWPFDTMDGFWSAPGIEQFGLYEKLSGNPSPYQRGNVSPYFDMLAQFGNPEFNNQSGYVGPFIDYGWIGGLIFMFAAGLIAGLLYRQFCHGKPLGLLVYPIFFVGLVEMPRYVYWGQGRATYAWLAIVIILVLLHRRRNKVRLVRHA
jgi:oligosaccharide repeat unit polymerase